VQAGVFSREIFRRQLGHSLRHFRQIRAVGRPGERQIGELGHRVAAGRHAVQAEGDVGDAVARRVELPVWRADQLAVRINLEFEPPARLLLDLLGPADHPFMEGVLGWDKVRQLEHNGLSGARRPGTEYDSGGQGEYLDQFLQRHDCPP
jgi:hypothetical protein